MSGKFLVRATAILLALFLAACGGDDSSSSLSGLPSGPGGGVDEPGTQPPGGEQTQAGSVILLTDRNSIGSSGTTEATLTALVRSSNGATLENVPVIFSVQGDATLIVQEGGITDSAGRATARLSAQPDKRNRTLTVSAQAGSQSGSVTVNVTGTSISVAGPSSVALGEPTTYTARLTDSAGNPISGQVVTVSSTLNNSVTPSTLTTTGEGTANFSLNASVAGTDAVRVSAYSGASLVQAQASVTIAADTFRFDSPDANTEIELNTAETIAVLWSQNGNPQVNQQIQFSAPRGTFNPANGIATTNGSGIASIDIQSADVGFSLISATPVNGGPTAQRSFEFVSTTPNKVNLQADRTQVQLGQSSTITAVVRDANNNLVKNAPVSFTLTDISGGTLSSSSGITNSQGRTQVTYNASSTTSTAQGGVEITATAGPGITDTLNLTVGGDALRLTLATGNTLAENGEGTLYLQPWSVIVTDASGNAVANQNVQLSVTSLSYNKGFYVLVNDEVWVPNVTATCQSEDINRNGTLDPGEDLNNNGILDPTNHASVSPEVTTGASGTASFTLDYGQDACSWVEVELKAKASVSGTEFSNTRRFVLSCLASDLNDKDKSPPGGGNSIYGVSANCNDTL
ncbi:MAG: Ig-like domain-containing protein [Marinobacter sp.]|nr:Ig-like domain-containing protein [Marinobacter sp.]